jgi:hypothetical protein
MACVIILRIIIAEFTAYSAESGSKIVKADVLAESGRELLKAPFHFG